LQHNRLTINGLLTLHTGTLPDTGFHRHGAMILLVSMARDLTVELDNGQQFSSGSILVDAGVKHRLLSSNEPFCGLYVEGTAELVRALRFRYLSREPVACDILSTARTQSIARYPQQLFELESWLLQAVREPIHIDSRILRATHLADASLSIATVAHTLHLSESRFSHLFKQEMSVSFKHYRLWRQANRFIRTLPDNCTLTRHAHESGFFDASHLSHSFRKLIGLSPSEILNSYSRIERC